MTRLMACLGKTVIAAVAVLGLAMPADASMTLQGYPSASYKAVMSIAVTDGGWSKTVRVRVAHSAGFERLEGVLDGQDQLVIVRPDLERHFIISDHLPGIALSVAASAGPLYVGAHNLHRMSPQRRHTASVGGEQCRFYSVNGSNAAGGTFVGDICLTPDGVMIYAKGTSGYAGRTAQVEMTLSQLHRQPVEMVQFNMPGDLEVMDLEAELEATARLLIPGLPE